MQLMALVAVVVIPILPNNKKISNKAINKLDSVRLLVH